MIRWEIRTSEAMSASEDSSSSTNRIAASPSASRNDSEGSPRNDIVKRVSTFQYDKVYRLVYAEYGKKMTVVASPEMTEKFSYDACGNRLVKESTFMEYKSKADRHGANASRDDSTGTPRNDIVHYTYDNDNRLMLEQDGGKNAQYTYDRARRLVKKDDSGKTERFKYDSRDLMTEYSVYDSSTGSTTVSSYSYDVNNLRVTKTDTSDAAGSIDNPTKRFVYDGQNILYDGAAFYLNNIMINSYEAEVGSLRTAVYLKDPQGSVRGELYDRPIKINLVKFNYQAYNYTAFGEQVKLTGADNEGTKEGISYTGHFFDKESKLYYARARYLDPASGRFITQDPIQDPSRRYGPSGLNRYIYGLNNPLRYTDPDGEWFLIDDLVAAAVGAVVGAVNSAINNLHDLLSGSMSVTDYMVNIGLGAFSGAVSMDLNHNGIPVFFTLSTKGYSVGLGYNFGGLVNVGASYHSDWSGDNYGFSTNAGLGGPNGGPGIGISMGADYSQQGGWTTNIGGNVSIGFGDSGASLSMGANAIFGSNGYEGYGLNGGLSYSTKVGDSGGSVNVGSNAGVNFDRNGQVTGYTAGLYGGYSGKTTNGSYMTYTESMGMSFDRYGAVTGTNASYSASRTLYSKSQLAAMDEANKLRNQNATAYNYIKQSQYKEHQMNSIVPISPEEELAAENAPSTMGKNRTIERDNNEKILSAAADWAVDVSAHKTNEGSMKEAEIMDKYNLKKLTPFDINDTEFIDNMKSKGFEWDYRSGNFINPETGVNVGIYQGSDGNIYASFIGYGNGSSGDVWKGIRTDIAMKTGGDPYNQIQNAKDVGDILNSKFGDKLILTGQSLGGGLASAAGVETKAKAITFNAPGLNRNTVNYNNTDIQNITAYDVRGEFVWGLLNQPATGGHIYLNSANWYLWPFSLIGYHLPENIIPAIGNTK